MAFILVLYGILWLFLWFCVAVLWSFMAFSGKFSIWLDLIRFFSRSFIRIHLVLFNLFQRLVQINFENNERQRFRMNEIARRQLEHIEQVREAIRIRLEKAEAAMSSDDTPKK